VSDSRKSGGRGLYSRHERKLGTYLMAAVPHATIIGFTGTPIAKTELGSKPTKLPIQSHRAQRDGSRDLIVRDVVGFSRSGLRVVLGLISGYFTQLACNSHPAA
jgi:hypothetical protein